jgi:nitroimidazol reductase NimA-like FMN-containing flavoprotein (pyridoxamine 5'-phosphate oxidase superfamily)
MTDFTNDGPPPSAAAPSSPPPASSPLERIDDVAAWELLQLGWIGRLGFSGRYGPMILPINFQVQDKAIYFRVAERGPTGEDLRTGIAHADYRVAFEVDEFDPVSHTGWSVLVQGDVHPMETEDERASVARICVESWASGSRELFLRLTPIHISGHRIGQALDAP